MGNEKSELEKLIEQAQEMVGADGSLWLNFDPAHYRDGGRWSIALLTSQEWKVTASDFASAADAVRGGIKLLLKKASSASDEVNRLARLAVGCSVASS